MKQLTQKLSDDCDVRYTVTPAGAGDLLALSIETMFPQAQRPTWQLNKMIIADRCTIWTLGTFLHESAGH